MDGRITIERNGATYTAHYVVQRASSGSHHKLFTTVYYQGRSMRDDHGVHEWQMHMVELQARILLVQLLQRMGFLSTT